MLLFLCSIEHSPLAGLLWALSPSCLPAALAPPRHHSCPASLGLSCPLQVWSGSQLCSCLASISPGVLACAKQPLLGRAPRLLPHQELPLGSSPCMQQKRRAGTRALFMHHWPRSTAVPQVFGRQKGCLSSIAVMLWKIPHGTTHPCCFFGVWSFLILILPVLTLQETGSAWPVFLLLLSVAL